MPDDEKERRGGREVKPVGELPFSVLARLYVDLRSAKVFGRKRSHSFASKSTGDSRREVLTQAWLQLANMSGRGIGTLSNRKPDAEFVPSQIFPPEDGFKLLSLIVPTLDSAHAYLGMKETKLAEAFVRALDLVAGGEDALWLKHHKEKDYRPQKWKQDATIVDGNFASVLRAVLKDRCPLESSLTIGIVWNALDLLSQSSRGRAIRTGRISRFNPFEDLAEYSNPYGRRDAIETLDDKRFAALRILVTHGTAQEVAEIARIILKDLDIRLSEEAFLNWFHPGAKQHYTQLHDIHQLLKDCFDPKFEVGEASVQVGQYASVMLTMRPSRKHLDSICEKLRGRGTAEPDRRGTAEPDKFHFDVSGGDDAPYFIMEPKLDGERLQLHKWRSEQTENSSKYEIRTFSRKGNDSSAMYAGALREVILSGVKAENVILDGEIMIWDVLMASWLRFEDFREVTTAIAKKNVPEGSSYVLRYMVFDVLYVDQSTKRQGDSRQRGNMVIRLPLHQRRALLEKLVRPREMSYGPGAKARIEVVGMERGYDDKQLTQALQRYETLGYEGVIAKNPDMPYVLAERSLDLSIKLKPDYFDGGIQDLDVLILGAKYSCSSGHRVQRAGHLSTFLVGVRAAESDAPTWRGRGTEWEQRMKRCKWIPVGSVGSGYSDNELALLQNAFSGEWRDFNPRDMPEHFEKREYAPNLLMDVAKWIQPWKSVVLTIRAYEVNKKFYALRFPRVERINWEKPYYDVPSFTHLLDLDENKLPAVIRPDEADVDDISGGPDPKKRKAGFESEEEEALNQAKSEGHMVTGGRNARTVIGSATGANVSKICRKSSVLDELTFHVIAADTGPKERLEVKIHELGGRFAQNLTPSVDYIICTSAHLPKVKSLRDRYSESKAGSATYPIVLSAWIDECHAQNVRILPNLDHIVYATRSLDSELFKTADRYGDSWMEDADADSAWKSFEEVIRWRDTKIQKLNRSSTPIEEDIEGRVTTVLRDSGSLFADVAVMVAEKSPSVAGTMALLKAMGAQEVEHGDKSATHLLVHSSVREKWEKLQQCGDPVVITEEWVRNSFDSGNPTKTE